MQAMKPGRTDHQNHKDADKSNTDCCGVNAGLECVSAQLRTNRTQLNLLQRERQLTDVNQVCKLTRGILGEVTVDRAGGAVDCLAYRSNAHYTENYQQGSYGESWRSFAWTVRGMM